MKASLWTQSAALFGCQGLSQALPALGRLGWDCFELSTEHLQAIEDAGDRSARIEQAVEQLRRLRASMPQAHAHLSADVAHPDMAKRDADMDRVVRNMKTCRQLRVEVVVVHPGCGQGYTTRAEYRRIARLNREQFRRLGDLAGGLGLRIAIENMGDSKDAAGRRRLGAAPHELLDLLDRLNHPALGICLDTSHMNLMGYDPAKTVLDLAPYLITTHISDNDGTGDQHRIPGDGTVDWPAFMAALRQAGYDGLVDLEIPGIACPVPDLVRLKVRAARRVADWLIRCGSSPPSP